MPSLWASIDVVQAGYCACSFFILLKQQTIGGNTKKTRKLACVAKEKGMGMSAKGIAGVVLAALTFTLAACGGGGGGGSPADPAPSDGTLHPGVSTDTFTPPPQQNPGTSTPPQQSPDSGSGQDENSTPGSGSGSSDNSGGSTGGSNENPPPTGGNTGGEPSSNCSDMISRCFDTANAKLAKYKADKQAAASYTFDDGYQTSFDIARLFESLDLRASFYIVAGIVQNEEWEKWKSLAERGHEIGTHSMTHTIDLGNPTLTDEQLDVEITQAQNLITQRIGIQPKVFAFPWHSYSARSRTLALQTHMAIRSPSVDDTDYTLSFFDQDHYPDFAQTLAAVNEELRNSVANGGWYVAAGHGLDGNGWSPVTTQLLTDHLNFALGFASNLWIDTYANVARYRLCRKQMVADVTVDSSQQMTVKLTGNYDASTCTAPLTVAIPLKEAPPSSLTATNVNGQPVSFLYSRNKLLLDVVPGQEIHVRTSVSTN
jgi:peptidoglycan/xylan/chitin deacetylase (PgdA/CDA1 family)